MWRVWRGLVLRQGMPEKVLEAAQGGLPPLQHDSRGGEGHGTGGQKDDTSRPAGHTGETTHSDARLGIEAGIHTYRTTEGI